MGLPLPQQGPLPRLALPKIHMHAFRNPGRRHKHVRVSVAYRPTPIRRSERTHVRSRVCVSAGGDSVAANDVVGRIGKIIKDP